MYLLFQRRERSRARRRHHLRGFRAPAAQGRRRGRLNEFHSRSLDNTQRIASRLDFTPLRIPMCDDTTRRWTGESNRSSPIHIRIQNHVLRMRKLRSWMFLLEWKRRIEIYKWKTIIIYRKSNDNDISVSD